MADTNRTLTVLICTHNRADLLGRTLRYLDTARRSRDWQVEILVAVNACSDHTLDALKSFDHQNPDGLPLRWFEETKPGKSNALNRAIPLIRSDLVAFVDDDHRVDTDYLVNICLASEHYPEIEFFCGRILPDWDGTEPEWAHETGPYRIYPLPVPRFDQGDEPKFMLKGVATPGGGDLFMRRELFARVGEFSPDFGPIGHNLGGAEDYQWVTRARSMGIKIQYIPDVIQYHYVDPSRMTLPYVIRKAYERSSSIVRINAGRDGKVTKVVPLYLFRKVAKYAGSLLFSFSAQKRRFYLVRVAAVLGEIKGYLMLYKERVIATPACKTEEQESQSKAP